MFNLVVVIFSVVMVLALGITGLYYGGEAYATRTKKTDYAEFVNGASQIQGAMELYKVRNGVYPAPNPDADELFSRLMSENFLSGVPDGTWDVSGNVITRVLEDIEQCYSVNEIAGFGEAECPLCSDPDATDRPACEA
jgi:hypothetical protein